jgi:hypothetical protein
MGGRMKRTVNPELDRIILDALAKRYKLNEKREGIHLSTLVYCLTKAYLDLRSPIEPTDAELLLFATGYGLQEVMFPSDERVFERDGIVYRPDGTLPILVNGTTKLIEIKSTRSGTKRYQEGDLPETWITYMMGGCYMMGTNTYDLGVIYLSERPHAKIISETVEFEQDELETNWSWLLARKEMYQESLDNDAPVPPFTTAKEWMCKNCRYINVCEAIRLMGGSE